MAKRVDNWVEWMDGLAEAGMRRIASMSGRRSLLHKAGTIFVGGAILPMLPYDNSNGVSHAAEPQAGGTIPDDCQYWRYCSLHGGLCSKCGGSVTQCPPGTTPSKVAWVGTCRNPRDNKDYLVSYNDCCGKAGQCGDSCTRQERDRPGYRMGLASESSWCVANGQQGVHCTVAIVVGLAE
ncbi:methylamine dehydrogenase light chain [Nguyenibacter vanlangensis]|uniref:Amine dehydrogenase n=1 Tax=Nguyenibacter vanlangensis TaxID=1216886 RepID=A0A7Y7M5D1_9PROT|nr:methylamine dehydrogenase light chain [Nguyenibacter vanlangensis]NVN10897.1 amine dehydrogenase [Nguyenibacter vanlangensis]